MGRSCFPSSLRFFLRSTAHALVVGASVCASTPEAVAGLVVNEVYYDHDGTDAGHEFVEIINTGSAPIPLDGVTLEFHNGSGAGWSTLWSGSALDTVAAHGLFAVGGALVQPPPDAEVELSLQNGPDAVGLFRDGVPLDLVGYGGLDDPGYVEGTGADAVAAGRSIARVPDGRDTGDNRADFAAAPPTPRRYNIARHDAFPRLAPPARARDVLEHGDAELALELVNGGTEPIEAGTVALQARDSTAAGVSPLGAWTNDAAIVPGESRMIVATFTLAEGYHGIAVETAYEPDERPENDALALVRRVGFPPLIVSEVLSSPPPGCPQFVEVYNAGAAPASIAGYGLGDRSHDPVVVATGAAVVEPGAFVVFTPDLASLRSCFDPPSDRVLAVDAAWPTFNRTGGEVADSVVFVDHFGLVVDAVPIPGVPTAAAGRSLERVDLYRGGGAVTWVLSQDARGATPGRAGTRALYSPPPPGAVVVHPNPFFPAEGVLTVSIDAPEGARAVATVFDAHGRRVAAVGVAASFPAVLVWNGRDDAGREALPGLYVVACEIVADGRTSVAKMVVGCARR